MLQSVKLDRPLSQFGDYREALTVLRDLFLSRGLSKKAIARKLGFGSASYLDMVIVGHRNLSSRAAWRIVRALELSPAEAEGFVTLVSAQNAKIGTHSNLMNLEESIEIVLDQKQLSHLKEQIKNFQNLDSTSNAFQVSIRIFKKTT